MMKRNEAGAMFCINPGKGSTLVGLILLFFVAALSGPAFAGEEHSDAKLSSEKGAVKTGQMETTGKVAARVNGVDIPMASVIAMTNRINARKAEGAQQSAEDARRSRKEALDRLIFQELAYQKAKAEGLTAEPSNVDTVITNLKNKLGSEEEYKKFLEGEAWTEKELRAQIERGIIIERIFAKEVYDNVSIPEGEIRKEYEKEKEHYFRPEKIVVDDIVFFLDTKDKDSMRKAEEIIKKVKREKNKDPLKLTPDGTFVVREMEIKKEKEKELYEAAKKLKVGGLSGVVITPDSLHVIKLTEYTPAKQFALDEVKVSVEAKLRVKVQQKRLREWEAALRKDAKIEIMENGDGKNGL